MIAFDTIPNVNINNESVLLYVDDMRRRAMNVTIFKTDIDNSMFVSMIALYAQFFIFDLISKSVFW